MSLIITVYFCRILSIILMYAGLLFGSIFTAFMVREFYYHSQLRTSLNLLVVTLFCTDCIRVACCAPLESYVLLSTWHETIVVCQNNTITTESINLILDFCRLTTAIRSCMNVVQPFGFVAISYERLRTIERRNGSLNLIISSEQQKRQRRIRLKYTISWIIVTLFLGIVVGLYQSIGFSFSNTCYGQSGIQAHVAMIIRILCILLAAFVSSLIYAKIFLSIRKHQRTRVIPMTHHRNPITQQRRSVWTFAHYRTIRTVKNTFVLFLSFFLCRIPSVILILTRLITEQSLSNYSACLFEEYINLSIQLTFLATITDPLAYIFGQTALRQKFFELPIVSYFDKNRIKINNQTPIVGRLTE